MITVLSSVKSFLSADRSRRLEILVAESKDIKEEIESLKGDIKSKFKAKLDKHKKSLKKNEDYKKFEAAMKNTTRLSSNMNLLCTISMFSKS